MGLLPYLIPGVRTTGIVMTAAGTDTLVYDNETHALHTLNQSVTLVWNACDGSQTVSSLAATTGLDAETVQQALVQLSEANLLAAPLPATVKPAQSRRAFMKKAAVGVAVPVIVSVTSAAAAQAASPLNGDCGSPCNVLQGACFNGGDPCWICIPTSWAGTGYCGTETGGTGNGFARSANSVGSADQAYAIEQQLWDEFKANNGG